MSEGKDIILVADYHCENIEFRWFNQANGQERTGRYPTTRAGILRQVEQAAGELEPGGQIVWIMGSTTGWARVKELLGGPVPRAELSTGPRLNQGYWRFCRVSGLTIQHAYMRMFRCVDGWRSVRGVRRPCRPRSSCPFQFL